MNTPNVATKPIISEDQANEITSAFEALFASVNSYGQTIAPSFDVAGLDGWERSAARALAAIKARNAFLKEEALRAVRAAVREVVSPLINAHREAHGEYLSALETMPKVMRSLVREFPTTVDIPVSEFSTALEGTDSARHVSQLKELGYTLVKVNGAFVVRVTAIKPEGTQGK